MAIDSYALSYINQRMLELGWSEFHHEPYEIEFDLINHPGEFSQIVQMQNEYLYLQNVNLINYIQRIISDTNVFENKSSYGFHPFNRLIELTGSLEFFFKYTNPTPQKFRLYFIRVQPTGKNFKKS